PSSRGDAARSKTRTFHPPRLSAMAAASPPMPAPTIKAMRCVTWDLQGLTACIHSWNGNNAALAVDWPDDCADGGQLVREPRAAGETDDARHHHRAHGAESMPQVAAQQAAERRGSE